MKTLREKYLFSALRLQKKPAVPALPSAFCSEEIHFCCLSHETCDTYSETATLANTRAKKKQKAYPLNTARAA